MISLGDDLLKSFTVGDLWALSMSASSKSKWLLKSFAMNILQCCHVVPPSASSDTPLKMRVFHLVLPCTSSSLFSKTSISRAYIVLVLFKASISILAFPASCDILSISPDSLCTSLCNDEILLSTQFTLPSRADILPKVRLELATPGLQTQCSSH